MAPIIRQPTGGGGGLEPADIGVTVQGYDSDLAAIAALSTTGLANRTGAGTWTTDSTSYQPLDSDLTAIAALTTTANGRSLLTASALTAAGLGLTNGAAIDSVGASPLTATAAASTYQPLDSDLTAIAALATTANGRSLLTASALTAAGLGLTNGAAIDSVGASPLTATTAASTYMPLAGGAFSGAVTSTSSISSRQSANTVQFLVTSGTAQTINWNSGGNINLDLSSASGNVTLTLQNPVSGATYRIRVQQGATVRNLIFPASTVQSGGGGTTYTGISGVDFLTVYYNGSAYLVQSALNSGFIQPTANAAFTGVTQLAALRLNTYAVIVNTAAPTTRTDSTALVAGDLWFNPSLRNIAFWNGTYWLSCERLSLDFAANTVISSTTNSVIDKRLPTNTFIDGISISLDATGTQDGSNNIVLTSFNFAAGGGNSLVLSTDVRTPYWNSFTDGDINYDLGPTDGSIRSNIPFSTPAQAVAIRATFVWTETGASSITFGASLWYRRVLG